MKKTTKEILFERMKRFDPSFIIKETVNKKKNFLNENIEPQISIDIPYGNDKINAEVIGLEPYYDESDSSSGYQGEGLIFQSIDIVPGTYNPRYEEHIKKYIEQNHDSIHRNLVDIADKRDGDALEDKMVSDYEDRQDYNNLREDENNSDGVLLKFFNLGKDSTGESFPEFESFIKKTYNGHVPPHLIHTLSISNSYNEFLNNINAVLNNNTNMNEVFGWSKKEKESKNLEQEKQGVLAELENYDLNRFYGTPGSSNLPELIKVKLNVASQELPKTYKMFPELFSLDNHGYGAVYAKIKGYDENGYVPFKWQFIVNNGEIDKEYGIEQFKWRYLDKKNNINEESFNNLKLDKPIIPNAINIISKNPEAIKIESKNEFDELSKQQKYFSASYSHAFDSINDYENNKPNENSIILFETGRELVQVWDNVNNVGYIVQK